MRSYLDNPAETALLAAILAAGAWTPWAAAAAAVFFGTCEIAAGLRGEEAQRWLPSTWPRGGGPTLTIVYDGTCALCLSSKKRLESWRTARQMEFVPAQSPAARRLLPDLPEAELMGGMHVLEGGAVASGADGWYRIMRLGPITLAWLFWVTPRALARPVYAWIARNRYRWFGRTCETEACGLPAEKRGPA